MEPFNCLIVYHVIPSFSGVEKCWVFFASLWIIVGSTQVGVLLRCPLVLEIMHGGTRGLPPQANLNLESTRITFTVMVQRKTNKKKIMIFFTLVALYFLNCCLLIVL